MLAVEQGKTRFADLDVPASSWLVLGATVVALLAFDLWRHREATEPTFREAATESALWVFCGVSFSLYFLFRFSADAATEYLGVYLTEKSLSIDNVFVWALLFSSMKVPLKYQHRVLFWGVFGALTLRAAFIFGGAAIVTRFDWVLVLFGVALVVSGLRLFGHGAEDVATTSRIERAVLSSVLPISDKYDGRKFFTRVDGARVATPLFAALVVIETTDIFFAVDSVPASFGVANDPFIILAANAFAIAGLRAMYFLLANARQRFRHLSRALGAILLAVGVKLVLTPWYHVGSRVSLVVIAVILAAAVGASLYSNRNR